MRCRRDSDKGPSSAKAPTVDPVPTTSQESLSHPATMQLFNSVVAVQVLVALVYALCVEIQSVGKPVGPTFPPQEYRKSRASQRSPNTPMIATLPPAMHHTEQPYTFPKTSADTAQDLSSEMQVGGFFRPTYAPRDLPRHVT